MYTRNLATANRSRVSCAHKVTTVLKIMAFKGHWRSRKCHGSIERI